MSINAAKSVLGGLLPFAANPVVLTVIGIGAASWAIASLFNDDEETESNGSSEDTSRSERSKQPLRRNCSTVKAPIPATVHKPLETADTTFQQPPKTFQNGISDIINSTIERSLATVPDDKPDPGSKVACVNHEDASKKEMIRQAMSELGKRSGAARRKKAAAGETLIG